MRRMLIALAVLNLFSPMRDADAAYLTPLGTGVEIVKYHVHGGGGLTLWISGISNPDSCGATNLVHIPSSLSGYKEMVAAVMSAHAQGKKVGLHASGCSAIPFWGGTTTYPIISDLWVTD